MAARRPLRMALEMDTSFAQFRGHLHALMYVLVALLALPAAAIATAGHRSELMLAAQAVAQADQADADHYAPGPDGRRPGSYWRAPRPAALSRGERKQVPELALRANVDADLARARSIEAVAMAVCSSAAAKWRNCSGNWPATGRGAR